jgi:multiple sugar transport system substrate-binding protein
MKRIICRMAMTFTLIIVAAMSGFAADTVTKTTIKFWKYQDENEQKTMEMLIERFNAQSTTTKVELQVFPFDQYLGEKLISSLAGGTGPDVFWLSAGDFLKYAMNDLISPLNDVFVKDLQADFLPNSLKAVSVGSNIYGIPHEMGVQSLIYDAKLFEDNHIAPPQTWDELIAAATKLKTSTRYGIILPTNPDVFENFIWYSYLWSAGGDVINADWTKARINEPEGIKALKLWGDLVKSGLASPKGGAPFDADVAQGKAAMAMLGHWVVDNFKQTYPKFRMGIAPVPPAVKGGKSVAAYGGWFTVVNSQSKHPKEAKEFAVWLFGKESVNAVDLLMAPGTYLSPRKSVMSQVQGTEYYRQWPHTTFIKDIWPNTRPEPAYPPVVVSAVTDALQEVMFGSTSAADAANKAAKKINEYLAGPEGDQIRKLLRK